VKKAVGYQTIGAAVFIGSIASFLPGLGPSQAAILGSLITRNIGNAGFLMLVGGLSTVNMVVSFVTLSFIEKARNGAVVIISQLIENVNTIDLIMFLSVTLITAGCATYLALMLARMFSKFMSKVNYKKLCLSVISFIAILVVIMSGLIGLLVLAVATCLGIVASLRKIGKNHLMGCLLLPVILSFVL